ncbi:MAG: tRNA 2-thiouridine(34) synthase MnmA [Chloroflexota bacterium]|nr:tRNA 2-thiouridine(34) synthase MnmA [Chloroflexota bacterium]
MRYTYTALMLRSKVAIALSGGVDSSVAALLLRETGYEVTGIHLQLWDSLRSQEQARQTESLCKLLDIPLVTLDLQEEFGIHVVDCFCQEYQQGRTPNPCIICNQHIKFGSLLQKALSMGFDYLATGHYARLVCSQDSCHLLKARDLSRDQSYFLYTLTQEKLRHLLFPLGSYSKGEVTRIARQEGLPTAHPSQDICFISHKNYHSFLRQRFSSPPGDVIDSGGKVRGHHKGIAFYTIGQRHGLGLASSNPLYVVRIEPKHNRIVLGPEKELYSQKIVAEGLNWVAGQPPPTHVPLSARIRYKSKEAEVTLSLQEEYAGVSFAEPQRAVAPGQAIVFYKGEEVLGGGIIKSTES